MTTSPSRAAHTPARARVLAAFAAVYVIWGSTYLAIRFAIETLPPFLMAAIRFLIAGTLLYAWRRARGVSPPTPRQWRAAAIVGSLLLLGGNGAVVWAEQFVPSGIAALIVAVVPLWMVLLDWVGPRRARPHGLVLVGLTMGFAGVALLIGPGALLQGAASGVNPVGAAVLLLGSLAWATGSLYSRSAPLPPAPLLATGMQMLCGGAVLLVVGLLAGESASLHPTAVSTRSALALLYLIVFGAIVGYSAYIWLLRNVPATQVSTYAYINPVVAVVLGWALAGEALSLRVLLAATIIVASVAVITAARPRARPEPE